MRAEQISTPFLERWLAAQERMLEAEPKLVKHRDPYQVVVRNWLRNLVIRRKIP
jgi:hypothetical protein